MALDRKAFDALVARYEALEKAAPRVYRLRVLAFALLGHAYIAFMVVPLIGMVALCAPSVMVLKLLGVKLLLILVPFTWLVFKSLWVRLHAPLGTAVTRKVCAALQRVLVPAGARRRVQSRRDGRAPHVAESRGRGAPGLVSATSARGAHETAEGFRDAINPVVYCMTER